uniref:uncharacterized protein n=1 Tax=Myxine glutinosa TaxID=7769 RepID=UPI00358FEB85
MDAAKLFFNELDNAVSMYEKAAREMKSEVEGLKKGDTSPRSFIHNLLSQVQHMKKEVKCEVERMREEVKATEELVRVGRECIVIPNNISKQLSTYLSNYGYVSPAEDDAPSEFARNGNGTEGIEQSPEDEVEEICQKKQSKRVKDENGAREVKFDDELDEEPTDCSLSFLSHLGKSSLKPGSVKVHLELGDSENISKKLNFVLVKPSNKGQKQIVADPMLTPPTPECLKETCLVRMTTHNSDVSSLEQKVESWITPPTPNCLKESLLGNTATHDADVSSLEQENFLTPRLPESLLTTLPPPLGPDS